MLKRTLLLFFLSFSLFSFTAAPSHTAAETFVDVTASYRAYDEIMYLAQGQIVSGNNGNFYPGKAVTRAEAAAMLGRALGLNGSKTTTSFKDVSGSSFASGYIQSAANKGIIAGYSNGTFQPEKVVTRGEMALFISRAFGYGSKLTMAGASSQLMDRGIAQGLANGDFAVNKQITRADYAVFLARAINYKLRITPKVTTTGLLSVAANGGLNVRTGPSTAYSVKGSLMSGAKVNEAYRVGSWVYVKTSTVEGFVSGSYVVEAQQENPASQPNEEKEPSGETPKPNGDKDTSAGTPTKPNEGPIPAENSKSLSSQVVVIDAGHGGSDNGADGFGLLEKNVNLDTALKVKALLVKTPFKIVMTREGDTYPTLSERVTIAKKAKGNAFISIHSNAFNGSGNGIETYFYSAAYNPYVSDSKMLATAIQNRLLAIGETKDRGVKAGNLHVLRENNMPATLVELGFIDNAADNAKLKSDVWRQSAAQAIYWGILDYYKQKGFNVSGLY
ncbi:N-acetylmuramoyl-L-alanine amidase [Bacillus benzoevorans]|uniref:N-acetylmuramoyl-L-alanine amidase n=1 Tax=Bacillus benzoevorans TaxID=1456 RepID=A0A7X0HP63_9BACI|nr:N-acetylmuramoyl-L-alanine amidase [Bacillus benzoevorans]MBB6444303.1 N-acetylmuramoyl-L-alanine amidase [Bacillus benzoevorans]